MHSYCIVTKFDFWGKKKEMKDFMQNPNWISEKTEYEKPNCFFLSGRPRPSSESLNEKVSRATTECVTYGFRLKK